MEQSGRMVLARWAKDALMEYDRISGGGCTLDATIPMVIASLLHLADQRSIPADSVLKSARDLYELEIK